MENYDPTKCQGEFLKKAFQALDLDPEIQAILSSPTREVKIGLPVKLRSGKVRGFKGYRVQHNNLCGPFKGGLRFHPSVDMKHCRALAFLMTWKTALFELPLGGGKGGIDCDPTALDPFDLEVLVKQFCVKSGSIFGPDIDIAAPDVGSGEREMAWFFEAYSKFHGFKPGVVTGKPLALEGIEGRKEATGYGVCKATVHALGHYGKGLEGNTIAIQGFGNVGAHAAKYLAEHGAKVVAVSDSTGAIFNPNGLDVPKLFREMRVEKKFRTVQDSTVEKEKLTGAELFELEVDVLIPAALEAAVTSENVEKLKCSMIVEAANIPVTYNADNCLVERGIPVVPDIFANAGGASASYLEWISNNQRFSWPRERVFRYLEDKFQSVWERLIHATKGRQLSLRDAAYFLAVKRVSDGLYLRGFY